MFTRAAQQNLERDAARFTFGFDTFPIKKTIPIGGERTDFGFIAIGGDQKSIVREELRGAILRVLVAGEVIVEALFRGYSRTFELDDDPRQTIDEERDVGDAFVKRALKGDLRNGQLRNVVTNVRAFVKDATSACPLTRMIASCDPEGALGD